MKLEERHYTLFKDECNRWIKFFGFSDWEIDFRFDDNMDVCASCAVNIAAHAAMLSLVDARRHGIIHRLSAIYKHIKGDQNG